MTAGSQLGLLGLISLSIRSCPAIPTFGMASWIYHGWTDANHAVSRKSEAECNLRGKSQLPCHEQPRILRDLSQVSWTRGTDLMYPAVGFIPTYGEACPSRCTSRSRRT